MHCFLWLDHLRLEDYLRILCNGINLILIPLNWKCGIMSRRAMSVCPVITLLFVSRVQQGKPFSLTQKKAQQKKFEKIHIKYKNKHDADTRRISN